MAFAVTEGETGGVEPRPYARLPSVHPVLFLSFRGAKRRGNPFFFSCLRRGVLLPSAASFLSLLLFSLPLLL